MIAVEALVEDDRWTALGDPEALAREALAAALTAAGEAPHGHLSLLLADDARLRELNARWRGEDKPTNVLSFPAAPGAGPPEARSLGDLALAYETVAAEAERDGRTLAAHAAHLLVHGALHLLGHDHASDEQAAAMEALEVEALRRIGVADPYGDLAA